MPNRIIKESITTSEDINVLSAGAEILFYRLIVKVDDFGSYFGNEQIIKSECFPLKSDELKSAEVKGWLDELVDAKLIIPYVAADGRKYIHLRTWANHQRIRTKKPKFPPFDESCGNLQQIAADCGKLKQNAASIQSNPIQSETESESISESESKPEQKKIAQPLKKELTETERQERIDHYIQMIKSFKSRGWSLEGVASLAEAEGITKDELNAAYAAKK